MSEKTELKEQPILLKIRSEIDPDTGKTVTYNFVMLTVGNESIKLYVPANGMDRFDYTAVDVKMQFSPSKKRKIAECIRAQIDDDTKREKVILVSRPGIYCCENFCRLYLGSKTVELTMPRHIKKSKYSFVPSDDLKQLSYDMANISDEKAAAALYAAMSIEPGVTDTVMAAVAVSLLRPFKEVLSAKELHYPLVFLCAPSGCGKSSFLQAVLPHYTSPGKMPQCCTRPSDTPSALRRSLDFYKDGVVLCDDLHQASESFVRRQLEGFLEVFRNYADEIGKGSSRSTSTINAAMIVSGEFILSGATNLARLMLINYNHMLDTRKLTDVQNRGNAVYNAAWVRFIEWAFSQEETVMKVLEDSVSESRSKDGELKRTGDAGALIKAGYTLLAAYVEAYCPGANLDKSAFDQHLHEHMNFLERLTMRDKQLDNASIERRKFEKNPSGYVYELFFDKNGKLLEKQDIPKQLREGRLVYDKSKDSLSIRSKTMIVYLETKLETKLGNLLYTEFAACDVLNCKGKNKSKKTKQGRGGLRYFDFNITGLAAAADRQEPLSTPLKQLPLENCEWYTKQVRPAKTKDKDDDEENLSNN